MWFYRKEGAALTNWRRDVLVTVFVANAVSAAVLARFIAQAYIASKGTKPVDLDGACPVFSMLGSRYLRLSLQFMGDVSRLPVLIAGGLLTAVLA